MEKDPDKAHHTRRGFRNPHGPAGSGPWKFLRWQLGRLWHPPPNPWGHDFPLANNDPLWLQHNRQCTTLTWIGHATCLLQLSGYNILTDPHFSARAFPVQWAGPQRVTPPGIALADLPAIDLVIISHDHYDHLDRPTIEALRARPGGDQTQFLVPLGLKPWFQAVGIQQVAQLDWWEGHTMGPLQALAVPAQHWSKRRLIGRNQTLWAGWVVQTPHFRFWFVGDSGYTPQFREIGRRLGPINLAAIPIGAYEPRWFMGPQHMSPEEAVEAHLDGIVDRSVAIHWGTFRLTDEPMDEPPKRLRLARDRRQLTADAFQVPRHGETLVLD